MATVKIKDEKQLVQEFLDLVHAGNNMRFWQKYWKEHHGGNAKARKEYWEGKFDDKLRGLGLTDIDRLKAIKIHS